MAKQTRAPVRRGKKHRAVKPRPVRPLDQRRPDNHEDRHAAKKLSRAAHEALVARQAEEKEAREAAALEDAMIARGDLAVDGEFGPVTQPEGPAS